MSETKLEHKQAKDEDERKESLQSYATSDLTGMIAEIGSKGLCDEFHEMVLQFVIDNNIDLNYF